MNSFKRKIALINYLSIILLFSSSFFAQDMKLVWADEFDGSTIDNSIWGFEFGPANDNVNYFTNRPENAKIVDGKLQVVALEESYQGFNYTSSLLKTQHAISWKYGRIEARIKLPGSNGFVPAFWMLPEAQSYGYWPLSGEIDILEHPTNEINKIYGTVHTGAYNSFTGSGPRGSTITISDAETEFHVYAIEWSEEKIDFFVDDQKYFTFNNEHSGFEAWPFDQPFYIILSMGVGGGWVGDPDTSSIFPAIMEIDYVRVYQQLKDVQISGEEYLPRYTKSSFYTLPNIEGASYQWKVTGDAEIVAGQNTNIVTIDWNTFSSNVEAEVTNGSSSYKFEYPVVISNNILKNYGFESGVSPWTQSRPYPGDIDFTIDSNDPHNGASCLNVNVKSQTTNAWDVQLSQRNLLFSAGKQYNISFWAKAKTSGIKINAAIINSTTIDLLVIKEITLTDSWAKYDLSFTPSSTVTGQINIDLGSHLGNYYFDDFAISLPELNNNSNQISNADFSNGNDSWVFNSFAPAVATGEVKNGEFAISISNGGSNLWDIHLGQVNVSCEKGKEYTVSFDAYADAPRTISALVGKNSDPWTVYSGNQIISLTAEKTRYSYSFIMNDPTDNQARLGFDLGTSTVDLYFDNILLSKGVIPTGIEEEKSHLAESFQLFQNYPNPFNPSTVIKYHIPKESIVTLKVYDVLGEEVETLINQNQKQGNYTITFNASKFSSGVYFYRLKTNSITLTKKMLYLE